MNENIFWDKKVTNDEVKGILKDEKNDKFVYFASIVLSEKIDIKEVFSDYLSKELFCRNWKRIKNRMRKNKWKDKNIDFWDEVYRTVKKSIDPARLKISKKEYVFVVPETKSLVELLKKTRKKRGMKQEDLANKTGLSQQTISALESGHINFSFTTLFKVLNALGVEIVLRTEENEYPVSISPKGKYIMEYGNIGTQEWRTSHQDLA
jgi:HTH-type transcriptional regulator/antitoxin HipB